MDASSKINLSNNSYRCPKGHTSKIPDGAFQVMNGVLHVRDGSGNARPVIEEIRRLATEAIAGKAPAEDALDAISLLSPDLGSLIKVAKGSNSALVVLALILWFIVQMRPGQPNEPIFIDARTTNVGSIVSNQVIHTPPILDQSGQGAQSHDRQHSKRKRRRIAGKEKATCGHV